MISGRPRAGVAGDELISDLTGRLDPATGFDPKSCLISSVFYKVGDEPAFFAILSAPSIEQARQLAKAGGF